MTSGSQSRLHTRVEAGLLPDLDGECERNRGKTNHAPKVRDAFFQSRALVFSAADYLNLYVSSTLRVINDTDAQTVTSEEKKNSRISVDR